MPDSTQLQTMLSELEMDYHQMNRRQYNLMEGYLSGGDPREWHRTCELALMRYYSIYQPYFQLLLQGRQLLGEQQLKDHLETARQMKQTIATTNRIIEQLKVHRQMEVSVPVESPMHKLHPGITNSVDNSGRSMYGRCLTLRVSTSICSVPRDYGKPCPAR